MAGVARPSDENETDATREKEREAFLVALRGSADQPPASVTCAAEIAGRSRATFYRWREEDEAFAAAWDDALESGTDRLEKEAIRRAVEGVNKPVFYKGKVVGHITEYSDTMLAMQLNARRPEKYRVNHKVEHTGGVKITIAPDDANL
jgi:hypothetical protein